MKNSSENALTNWEIYDLEARKQHEERNAIESAGVATYKETNLCPASLLMACAVLLSCFAFMFSTSQTQQIASSVICAIASTFFFLIRWVNNSVNKF